jgi:hypothetical protein
MTSSRPTLTCSRRVRVGIVVACLAAAAAGTLAMAQSETATSQASRVMPRYDANRNLLLPDDYRRWVLAGTSLGLSYSEGAGGMQMFNTTLIEPSAYRHFAESGEFREGTMLALVLQGVGTNAMPARRGQFATDVHGVEMAVKDSTRVPEGWAYYNFGGSMMGGLRSSAAPQPRGSCYNCHDEHAARDHVFLQFYRLLSEAAPKGR